MFQPSSLQLEEKLWKLGVHYQPSVVGGTLLKIAAEQSAALHSTALYRASQGMQMGTYLDVSGVSDRDYRITHIHWPSTEIEDADVADNIQTLTGIECGSIFLAARSLLRATGFMQDPEERRLTIFQTTQTHNLNLHKDGEEYRDFEPDDSLMRAFLHLRGGRLLGFADDAQSEIVDVSLRPGDVYDFCPTKTYHSAEYSDESLAIYVQS